jgi:hypothetical protein
MTNLARAWRSLPAMLLVTGCVSFGEPQRPLTVHQLDIQSDYKYEQLPDPFQDVDSLLRPTEVSARLISRNFDPLDSMRGLTARVVEPTLSCLGDRLGADPTGTPEVVDVRVPLRSHRYDLDAGRAHLAPVVLSASSKLDGSLLACIEKATQNQRMVDGTVAASDADAPYVAIHVRTPPRALFLKHEEEAAARKDAEERAKALEQKQAELDRPWLKTVDILKDTFGIAMPSKIAFANRAVVFDMMTGATNYVWESNVRTAKTLPLLFSDAKKAAVSRFGTDLVDAYLARTCNEESPQTFPFPASEPFSLTECLKLAGVSDKRAKELSFESEMTRLLGKRRKAVVLHDGAIGSMEIGGPEIDPPGSGSPPPQSPKGTSPVASSRSPVCGDQTWTALADALASYCQGRPVACAQAAEKFAACVDVVSGLATVQVVPSSGEVIAGIFFSDLVTTTKRADIRWEKDGMPNAWKVAYLSVANSGAASILIAIRRFMSFNAQSVTLPSAAAQRPLWTFVGDQVTVDGRVFSRNGVRHQVEARRGPVFDIFRRVEWGEFYNGYLPSAEEAGDLVRLNDASWACRVTFKKGVSTYLLNNWECGRGVETE